MTRNGRFLTDYVESEKNNLIDTIRSIIDDKRDYADLRLLQEMCRGERYGIARLGEEADVRRITNQTLYRYYRELLGSAQLELFYCGSADPTRVQGALERAFAGLPRERLIEPVPSVRLSAPEQPRYLSETMDVTQGKLSMGFRASSDDAPALLMANLIFGGYSNSKLFLNVREKLSLCYYAQSGYHRSKGIIPSPPASNLTTTSSRMTRSSLSSRACRTANLSPGRSKARAACSSARCSSARTAPCGWRTQSSARLPPVSGRAPRS